MYNYPYILNIHISVYVCIRTHTHTPHKSTSKNGQQKYVHIFMGYIQRTIIYGRSDPDRIVLDIEIRNYHIFLQ